MEILTSKSGIVRTSLPRWQEEMRTAIRSRKSLLARLELDQNDPLDATGETQCQPSVGRSPDLENERNLAVHGSPSVEGPHTAGHGETEDFPVFAPESYLRRIEKGNPDDPLLLQILPAEAESVQVPGFDDDPVGDEQATRRPGLIQKYAGRVLVLVTGACGIHCRYCFRQHHGYGETAIHPESWKRTLDEIAQDSSLTEVILSGGDPFVTSDNRLEAMMKDLDEIPHLKRLRIHTRMPIVIPSRVTSQLCETIRERRLRTVIVVHANHPQEIDEEVAHACSRLIDARVTLLNQSVLLRGVNDDEDCLSELSNRLMDCGVIPYYLHQLDRVRGASHFEVAPERGLAIVERLRIELPGYLVPRYVCELAGEASKTEMIEYVQKRSGQANKSSDSE